MVEIFRDGRVGVLNEGAAVAGSAGPAQAAAPPFVFGAAAAASPSGGARPGKSRAAAGKCL